MGTRAAPVGTREASDLRERLVQVRDQIPHILQADREAQERAGHAPHAADTRRVGHDRGVLDEGLEGAQGRGQSEDARARRQLERRFLRGDLEGEDPAHAARILPLRELIPRVRGQPRIVDRRDLGVGGQELGDSLGVRTVALDAQGQGFQATVGQVRVARGRHVPEGHLQLHGLGGRVALTEEGLDVRGQLQAIAQDERTADHVGVAAHVLGRRMHDDVRAQLEGALQDRRGEGVVHTQQAADLVREGSDGLDVRDRQERVRGCLHPHDLGARAANHALGLGQVGQVRRLGGDALGGLDDTQELVGAAIHVCRVHDVVAGARQQADHRVLGAHARREREAVRRPFQGRERARERVGRRVAAAPILIPAAQLAGPILHERRCDVNRRHHITRDGVGVEPGVDGQRGEGRTVRRAHTVTVRGLGHLALTGATERSIVTACAYTQPARAMRACSSRDATAPSESLPHGT